MFTLGLDLGGTSIKAGVVDGDGRVVGRANVPTGPTAQHVLAALLAAGEQARIAAGVGALAAVGVASPGVLSTSAGIVHRAANLPGLVDFPLRDRIADALGIPAVLENDANAAAFGEYQAGVARALKPRSMAMLTLGTGVGGGLVLEGRVHHGTRDFAGEVGHTITYPDGLACPCGQRGCLEQYASARAVAVGAAAALEADGRGSALREVVGAVTAEHVARAAAAGDALAGGVWSAACRALAVACVNLARTLDLDLVVLGGGMSAAGSVLLDTVRAHYQELHWTLTPPEMGIELATLGADAGVVGAAALARQAAGPS